MSVSQENRKENVMNTVVKAMSLSIYTTHICKNENVFSPENDFNKTTTTKIVNTAQDIYMNCFKANGIYARKGNPTFEEDLKERIRLQKEAIKQCNNLYALAYLAQKQFHLPLKKLGYWSKLITEVKRLIAGWCESDCKRLKS